MRVDISWQFICVDPAALTCCALEMDFSVFLYSVAIYRTWQPESNWL